MASVAGVSTHYSELFKYRGIIQQVHKRPRVFLFVPEQRMFAIRHDIQRPHLTKRNTDSTRKRRAKRASVLLEQPSAVSTRFERRTVDWFHGTAPEATIIAIQTNTERIHNEKVRSKASSRNTITKRDTGNATTTC